MSRRTMTTAAAKIIQRERAISWIIVFSSDECTVDDLKSAYYYCLTDQARVLAQRVSQNAESVFAGTHQEFVASMIDRR